MADLFSDPGYKNKVPHGLRGYSTPNYTPAQMNIHKQNYAMLGPDTDLARMAAGDQSFYEQLEAPALRQFSGFQGGLASRYSGGAGRGGLSNRRSSGFQNEQGEYASNFAQQLQANRQNLQRQAQLDLWNMSQQFLGQTPFNRDFVDKKQKGGWGEAIGKWGGFIPGALTGDIGGAARGAGQVFSSAMNLFGGGGGGSGQNMYNVYQ